MLNEYLITNQLGGYSSSDLLNGNTRKYHGLLIVSNKDLNRKVIVGSLEEKVISEKKEIFLNTFKYKSGVKNPDGLSKISKRIIKSKEVLLEYEFEDIVINKSIAISQEENSIIVRYQIKNTNPITFSISPFVTNRSIHKLIKYSDADKLITKKYLNTLDVQLSKKEQLTIKVLSFNPKSLLNINYYIDQKQYVYKDFKYDKEEERGLDSIEDQIKIADFQLDLESGDNYITMQFNYMDLFESKNTKTQNVLKPVLEVIEKDNKNLSYIKILKNLIEEKSQDFLIDNEEVKTIIAGFHWFSDWGRDTFISFKGLLLNTKKFEFAKELLKYWGLKIKGGLIPNELSNKSYNSIDASLWYIVSIYYYYLETKDNETILFLEKYIKNIISEYYLGTDFGIHVNSKGYLVWDNELSLSWMDSSINGKSATGRKGVLIEIQLLWYNVLKVAELFDTKLNTKILNQKLISNIKLLHKNINLDFWIESLNYTYDYIYKLEKNDQIRPNIIIGLSLPFKVFTKIRANKILNTAKEELLNDYGLYTLCPKDKGFIKNYSGSINQRDLAYHNGAVWPYLLGMYNKALYNYNGKLIEKDIKDSLIKFCKKTCDMGLNYIPEIFTPIEFKPEGTLSQAWNYALFLENLKDIGL